tara:strand:- start:4001 stop:4417 length:417 start_codon:yes stop_codon:yes gene_type:complete
MTAYMAKAKTDSWSTPTHIYNDLNDQFHFNSFDPCPLNDDPNINGLDIEWADSTFCNPPYSRLKSTIKHGMGWVEKAHIECLKGKTVVLLLPARTDTQWFHDIILKNNYEVRFVKGRLCFGGSKFSAPFPSMVIIMTN